MRTRRAPPQCARRRYCRIVHLRRLAAALVVAVIVLGCSPAELRLYPVAAGADVAALEATRAALQARVQALGHEDVAVELGSGPSFVVKMDPEDALPGLLRTLAAPGRVTFVAIPVDAEPPDKGTLIDPRLPVLFGPEAVMPGSGRVGTNPNTGGRTVEFRLTEFATDLFRRHTSGHVGEYFAIVVDGAVVAAPMISAEIPNGEVVIETGEGAQALDSGLAAYLASGPLPIAIVPPPS